MSIAIPPRLAPPPVAKAGPIGPGSGVLLTEFPLTLSMRETPQRRMARYWAMSYEVSWIAAAEDAITQRMAGVDWHLEDGEDNEIDDQYPSPDAQAALALMEKPGAALPIGARFTRTDLWELTGRAMGVCGSAFLIGDAPEALAGTPSALLPIAPWRMFANEDERGNLTGWAIDKTPNSAGIQVPLEQVLHFRLRPSFSGHFGVGLMESATRKISITLGLDDHVNMVISAGGRLSGILSPKTGALEAEQMLQMERDWRTVVDQSDAAKKLQLVRGPIQFDRTTLTPQELVIAELMKNSKDDLLALWGVPYSIIGGASPSGLNSGDTRKYDEAAIWQGPVHHRLTVFTETMQYQLLDKYAVRGTAVELEVDEPEFDDDSPRYDLLGKSLNTPMRNVERRALIGLPPFGDPLLDNQVVLPATIVPFADAPDEETGSTSTEVALGRAPDEISTEQEDSQPAMLAAGETAQPKADISPRVAPLHSALTRYRGHAQSKYTPLLKTSVNDVLHAQRADIAARLRKHAGAIAKQPRDTSLWFTDKTWDARLRQALAPRLEAVAHVVNATIHDVLPQKQGKAAPPGAVERVMTRGAARVTGINRTTREKIQEAVIRGLDEGLTVLEVADLIEAGGDVGGLSTSSLFDDYRAEMIARTELMDAYNATAIASYSDAGVEMLEAIDGDEDEECIDRLARNPYTIDEADAEEDHPNGTLDWVPLVGEVDSAAEIQALDEESKAVIVARPIVDPGRVTFSVEAKAPDMAIDLTPLVSSITAIGEMHRDSMETMRAVHTDAMDRISTGLSNLSDQVANQPAPVVNVPAPVVNVAPTPVTIPAPVINVPAPIVNVENPPRKRTVRKNNDGSYSVTEQ